VKRDRLSAAEARAVARTLARATRWRALPSPIIVVRASRRRRAPTRTLYVCVAEGCGTVWATGSAADMHAMKAHPWGVRLDFDLDGAIPS
jgi:hypothetical protein